MAARILTILQARMSSSRFPRKVLADLQGEPMLARQIERLHRAQRTGSICVATSVDASDDPLEQLCHARGIDCFRGSLEDVLDRFYQAAAARRPEHVVRVTGDCPLIDPAVVDAVIDLHLAQGTDYASNTIEPTYPDGLDVEVCTFAALARAWSEARLPSQREHVTPYIKLQPGLFRVANLRNDTDLSALRWTVDYPRDLDMVRAVYAELYPRNPAFGYRDVLALVEQRPEIARLAADVVRDEGYLKSLANDRKNENTP
jgi:spore coat polysaccharide biosynthesis protein SpsF